jgi:TetR/AcrR family transcriptional regulator, mexJK operon transcriptional repressor
MKSNSGAPRRAPRRSGRPPKGVAAQLPELLLEAAERLFLAQGYSATSVEQVAAAAGATKRTIYAKFDDKAGLFSAMAKRVVERRRAWVGGACEGATVEERLVDFGKRLLALALAPDVLALNRVMVAEAHRFPEIASLVDQLAAQGARRRLAEIIAAEARCGSLAVADPALAAELLLGMIVDAPVRAGLFGRKSPAGRQRAHRVETAVSVFLDGTRRRSRAWGRE